MLSDIKNQPNQQHPRIKSRLTIGIDLFWLARTLFYGYSNAAAERILGRQFAKIAGKIIHSVIHHRPDSTSWTLEGMSVCDDGKERLTSTPA